MILGPLCTCGTENIGIGRSDGDDDEEKRIIGGTETAVNKYPWMVSIRIDKDSFIGHCGGTLVASKYVISAAHCFWIKETQTWIEPSKLQLILGEHFSLDHFMPLEPFESVVDVAKIMGHKGYDGSQRHDNDIAVIELAKEVNLIIYTPACLPSSNYDFAGETASVYGWGLTQAGNTNSASPSLLEVDVPVVSNDVCGKTMPDITPGKLCAGGQLGKDACRVRN